MICLQDLPTGQKFIFAFDLTEYDSKLVDKVEVYIKAGSDLPHNATSLKTGYSDKYNELSFVIPLDM